MNKISKRTLFSMVLAVVLLAGLVIFCARFVIHADDWVTTAGSPHVYSGTNLNSGIVTDRTGTVLLDATDGRAYAADSSIRSATMHILGDRAGYIPSPVLEEYSGHMIGFDLFNGVYRFNSDADATAQLTLDAGVQSKALELLSGYAGTIGIYNYETGEILCAATSPSYDPDNAPDIENDTSGQYDGVYVNRFFYASYVPGSIFKLVTAAAAIEQIPDIMQQTFTCNGSYEVGADTITCNGVHGEIGFQTALSQSCNCAFGQIAQQLGPETMTAYAKKLGIGESLSFDGIKTAAGNFDLTGAAESNLAWSGIGQYTDTVNPCQYMTLMGAIARGGSAAKPYLVESVRGGSASRYQAHTETVRYDLSESTASTLAEMMHNNVVNVYGEWNFPDVVVCAKSGTAELDGETPNAMFAGFLQDERYPLAFIVVVEHGGSGSQVAGTIAGQILNACVDALDNV